MQKKSIVKYGGSILLAIAAFVLLSRYLKSAVNSELTNVTVSLMAKVPKDDVFQLFYWERSESKFQIKKSVRTPVKGSDDFQEIEFELPTITNLFRLRLDIGENKEQQKVSIKKLRFMGDGYDYDFSIDEFNKMFGPNKYIKVDTGNQFLGIEGGSGEKVFYDPYFISNDGSKEMEMVRANRLTDYPYLVAALVSILVLVFFVKNMNLSSVSSKGVFITFFILILILPTLQTELGLVDRLEDLEKRELAEKPVFSFTKKYARDFETYFDDNFGFRSYLVNWGGVFKTKMFQSSIHPELVKFGKKKWLFYNRMKGRMYRSYSRTNILPQDTLKMLIDKWQDNKKRYEADGRKYFMAFWPNKHSIYPEFLPATMKVQIKDTLPRVDQIMQHIQNNATTVKMTDVRPALFEGKKTKTLYRKFDSHWNDYGAFLAYRSFFNLNKNKLEIEPKIISDFNVEWKEYNQGELIQMLGIQNKGYFREQKPIFTLKENQDQIEYLPIDGFPKLTVITKNKHAGNSLRALIFRDSFSNSLIQFFSLHFHEVYYIWGHHEQYVEQLDPDIIVDGFVEREVGEKIQ